MESILTSIKKLLGIAEDYEYFDADIIIHINSAFMVLRQIGVGPINGYSIKDKTNTWDEFTSGDSDLEAIKTYIYLRVRLAFDPPSSSAVMDSMNKQLNEYEWRLNVSAESKAGD